MKYDINANPDQLNVLYDSLKKGVPLSIALKSARIEKLTYYYWVALGSVAMQIKEEQKLEELKALVPESFDLDEIQNQIYEEEEMYQDEDIIKFIKPTEEQLYQYKVNNDFRTVCNEAHEIIKTCETKRTEAIMFHLGKVAMDGQYTKSGKISARASMWFLEKAVPNYFGRKPVEEEIKPSRIEKKPLKVEFVDPNTDQTAKRIEKMRNSILNVSPNNKVDA